jgi:polysaccharide export outer membrane protein
MGAIERSDASKIRRPDAPDWRIGLTPEFERVSCNAGNLRRRLGRPVIAAVAFALGVACAGAPLPLAPVSAKTSAAEPSTDDAQADPTLAYRLGSGDKLRVIVFGEEDLSGEFEVDGTGSVSLPLIGQVSAQGETLRGFEEAVEEALRDGYLKNPRVSAEVLNYRPFYIIGEVETGGEYPFVSGMHVLNAVALAGGYTYRANADKVFITRRGREHEFSATSDAKIQPGDVVRVPERFF